MSRAQPDVIDTLVIDDVRDRSEGRVPKSNLRLRLQTIDHQQGYWLDTGILLDR
jgi:hypothetical protein